MDNKQKQNITKLFQLIEKYLKQKKINQLNKTNYRLEFNQIVNFIIQDIDIVNVYERRNAGISDKEWDLSIKAFKEGVL